MAQSEQTLDSVLPEAIRRAAVELSQKAVELGPDKIRERPHMQLAFRKALTGLLGDVVLANEPKLHFEQWQGIPERPGVGGIDLAVTAVHGYRAFIELKWSKLDGEFLGWAIWDFFKMATGRISPGADSCYLIASAPAELWAKPDTVGELFCTERWRAEDVLRRHHVVWIGDGNDYKKLTALPVHIETILGADEIPPAPLADWAIKAIRIEPDPIETAAWLGLHDWHPPGQQ